MTILSEYSSEIKAASEKLYPDNSIQLQFYPLSDLTHGDLASDICMQISKIYRCSPREASQKLLSTLPTALSSKLFYDQGFLNLRLGDSELLDVYLKKGFKYSHPQATDYQVVLIPPSSDLNEIGYLRLATLSLWQVLFLKKIKKNFIFQCAGISSLQEEVSLETFKNLIPYSGKAANFLDLTRLEDFIGRALLPNSRQHRNFVWMGSQSISKEAFYSYFAQKGQVAQAVFPSKDWLVPVEKGISLTDMSGWQESELKAAMLTLAGPLPAASLDLSVCGFQESDNNLWLISSNLERIRRHFPEFLRRDNSFQVNFQGNLSETERTLIHRLAFFDFFIESAALNGEVSMFFVILHDFLQKLNFYLNWPQTRLGLQNAEINSIEAQIIAGLEIRLSDIIAMIESI